MSITDEIRQYAHSSMRRGGVAATAKKLGVDFAREQKDEMDLQKYLPWAKELASWGLTALLAPLTGGLSFGASGLIKSGTSFLTDTIGDFLARDVLDLGGRAEDIRNVGKYGKSAYNKITGQVRDFRGSITDVLGSSLLKGYTSAAMGSDKVSKMKGNLSKKYLQSDIVPQSWKDSITDNLIEKEKFNLLPYETLDIGELSDEALKYSNQGETILSKMLNKRTGTRGIY